MFSFVDEDLDFAHKLDKPNEPTEVYHKHFHLFNEILFLVYGDMSFTVETETRRIEKGDMIIIPSGAYHFATVNPNVAYERYVLKFPDKYLPEHTKAKIISGSSFFHGRKNIESTFNTLDKYYAEYNDEELHTLFYAELVKLITFICHDPVKKAEKNDDLVTNIQDFIENNLEKDITFEMLESEFHYSKSFICSEFNKRLHISLMKYIRMKKIFAAHQLILSGVKKKEAAEAYGFETYSTFYRAYKALLDTDDATEE